MSLAVLSNQTLPLPILLDTVRHAETGHLSLDQARNARSTAGAIGPYQFLERYLPEFGYGMPTNIPVADVQDPARARELAGQYITGYSQHHDFQTPLQKLVAYNMGPNAAAEWITRGENVSELPAETQDYIRRAAAFLTTATNQNQTIEEPKMSDFTYFGIPITSDIASQLQSVHEINKQRLSPEAAAVVPYFENQLKPNASATAVQENVLEAMQNKQMKGAPSNAPAPVLNPAPQASGATTSPALTDPVYIPITQAAGFSANPQPAVSNRRDMSALAMTPPKPIGMNEMLIRMGAAGLGASAKGGLQSLEAIGSTYGAIQDANRQAGLDAYKAQMSALGKQKKGGTADTSPYTGAVLDSIDVIEGYLEGQGANAVFNNPFNDVTGPFGAMFSNVPGMPAYNVAAQVDTIEAAIGFDRLQAMRDASPTGGALGQVSEMELRLLKSSLGSLRQAQTATEFKRALSRIKEHYLDVVHGKGNRPGGTTQKSGGTTSLNQDDQALIDKYLN